MPESPDFESIADEIVMHEGRAAVVQYVAEQLRIVWNARGVALIDPVTNAVDEWVRAGAGTYDELQTVVDQAIKKHDR